MRYRRQQSNGTKVKKKRKTRVKEQKEENGGDRCRRSDANTGVLTEASENPTSNFFFGSPFEMFAFGVIPVERDLKHPSTKLRYCHQYEKKNWA
jgi:hypothetical protein